MAEEKLILHYLYSFKMSFLKTISDFHLPSFDLLKWKKNQILSLFSQTTSVGQNLAVTEILSTKHHIWINSKRSAVHRMPMQRLRYVPLIVPHFYGQHPARVGILDYLRPNSSNALPVSHVTLPRFSKQRLHLLWLEMALDRL